MVKYDKRNKLVKHINEHIREILDEDEYNESDDSFDENIECEVFEEQYNDKGDLLEKELSSSSSNVGPIEFVPGKIIEIKSGKIIDNKSNKIDEKQDFPEETECSEMDFTTEHFKKMTLVDTKEYRNNKNIINSNKKKKKETRRCPNIE